MVYNQIINGRYVTLRSVNEEDARFTMEIRQDKEKTRYLHKVEYSVEKQIEWIKQQREAEGDYFFLAQSVKDGKELGTIGVYDIKGTVGHLGRLLMVGNPFQSFEATLLAMQFAYNTLELEELYGDVHVDNKASLNISEAVGIHFKDPVFDKELDRWVKYGTSYKTEFPRYESEIKNLIYRD